jgi:hypothetical protein
MNEEGSCGGPGHVFRVFFLQETTSLMCVIDVSFVGHDIGSLGQAQSRKGK